MKCSIKPAAIVALLAALTTLSMAAPTLIGVWHAHLTVDSTKFPPFKDANEKAKFMVVAKQIPNTKIMLTLKGDHTFNVVAFGGPFPTPSQTGTWAVKGSEISITTFDKGKPGGTIAFTFAKDHRSFKTVSGYTIVTFFK